MFQFCMKEKWISYIYRTIIDMRYANMAWTMHSLSRMMNGILSTHNLNTFLLQPVQFIDGENTFPFIKNSFSYFEVVVVSHLQPRLQRKGDSMVSIAMTIHWLAGKLDLSCLASYSRSDVTTAKIGIGNIFGNAYSKQLKHFYKSTVQVEFTGPSFHL